MTRLALPLTLALVSSCAATRFVPLPPSAEPSMARTADGWEVSLVRYRAEGAPTGRPVLLCHGIASNGRNMDLDEGHSMARFLAAHGREAWVLSLRGTGDSRWAGAGPAPAIDFDDFWKRDLPAALDAVRRATGAASVDFVGHSMGGMILYAYLSTGGRGIGAAATLGSPTRLDWGTPVEAVLRAVVPRLPEAGGVPTAFATHLVAPLQGLIGGPLERLFYMPGNTRPEVWQRLLAYGTADIALGVAHQLGGLADGGRFASREGVDFRPGLAANRTPVLVVAARLDRVAPVAAVKDGYEALGGPKAWLLITRANGASAEYGHMDLIVGERAAAEVWSKVLDFLQRHAHEGPDATP